MNDGHDITPEEAKAAYQGGRERRAKNLAFAYAAYPWRVRYWRFVQFLEFIQGEPRATWYVGGRNRFRRWLRRKVEAVGMWVFRKIAPKFFVRQSEWASAVWPEFPLNGPAKGLRPLHPSRLPKPGASNHFRYYRYDR